MLEENLRQYVTSKHLEELLAEVEKLPGDPQHGFFGPDSITWQVNRESAVFLGAGRAALLQLAHPWVAVALAHHSNLINDAIGRFHSTFRVIYTMLYGTRAQALEASLRLHQRHIGIRGELPTAIGSHPRGEHYEANQIGALLWVFATLVDSAILAYEFALPPLLEPQRERYYAESRLMAALFGIPAAALPADWQAFQNYFAAMAESPLLGVDDKARSLGQGVLSGVGTWIRPPHWYRSLTAFWMPPRLRDSFDLPFAAKEEAAVKRAAHLGPLLYRRTPKLLRFVGPYHEAQARLQGRSPGLLTRKNNCFWMGQPHLMYPQLSR